MSKESPSNIRRAVLKFLYERNLTAHMSAPIRSRLVADTWDVSVEDVQGALNFLESKKYCSSATDPLGSDKSYQITAEGTLFYERNL